jgi:hypothetical protein
MLTGDAITHWLHALEGLLPLVVAVITVGLLVILGYFVATSLLTFYRLFKQKVVFLELTPPAEISRSPEATQQLFVNLYGLNRSRSLPDKLLSQKIVFATEIPSTRPDGMRFTMRVPKRKKDEFMQAIATYNQAIKVRQVDDYMPKNLSRANSRILEFKQTGYFAYPLLTHDSLTKSDPLLYPMGAMAKPSKDEVVILQIVAVPTSSRASEILQHNLYHNEELIYSLGKHKTSVWNIVRNIISTLSLGFISLVSDGFHGPSRYDTNSRQRKVMQDQDVASRRKLARSINPIEQDLLQSVHDKLSQQKFRVTTRAIIYSPDATRRKSRKDAVKSSFEVYSTPGYQSLGAKWDLPYMLRHWYRAFAARHRLPTLFAKKSLLSASELASLYHFPSSVLHKAENTAVSRAKTLPAPPEMKRREDTDEFEVILGNNEHAGEVTPLSLVAAERARHLILIGSTGSGKTTVMEYAATQDIYAGRGLAYIDPHGDSAKKLLKIIPKERVKDVVYISPNDIAYPVGLNPIEMPEGLSGDEYLIERGRVTSALISIMRKVFGDDESTAHNIEAIMRNVLHTALTVEGATIFTILKLLRNKKFRKSVVAKLDDDRLKDFWREEFGEAGGFQRVSMTKGVNHRIDSYESSEQIKRMLGQAKSTISFEDIMDSGKILICNLGKGDINEDESALIGTTILAKLKLAAERRSSIPEDQRRPFYVYVDEFQNFATKPFVTMMSEARKFKLYLTIAEQSTEQQEDPRLTQVILGNARTLVLFGTGSSKDEERLLPRFAPHVEQGELLNLPIYHFYLKTAVEIPMEPTSGITVKLESKYKLSDERAQEVMAASRRNYARKYVEPNTGKKSEKPTNNKVANQVIKNEKQPQTSTKAKLKNKSIGSNTGHRK